MCKKQKNPPKMGWNFLDMYILVVLMKKTKIGDVIDLSRWFKMETPFYLQKEKEIDNKFQT